MELHQWRHRLLSEMRAHKVPRSYVRRLLGELEDHIVDLQEARMSQCMEAEDHIDFSETLGSPERLAEQAAAVCAYPTWPGRHPRLAFLVGPPVLFLLAVAAFTLLIIGVASLVEGQTADSMPALTQICQWVAWAIVFVPAVVASLLFCRTVNASGRKRHWALAACSLIALFGGCLMVSCVPPQSVPGTGRLTIGFGIDSTWRIGQAIAPLMIGAAFMAIGTISRQQRGNAHA